MKNLGKLAVLGAVLAASASLAFASPISGSISVSDTGGSYSDTLGTLNFGGSGFVSGTSGAGTTLSSYTAPNVVTFNTATMDFSTTIGTTDTVLGSGPTSGGTLVFATTEGGLTLDYYETSVTTDTGTGSGSLGALNLSGLGYFTETGLDATVADFSLTGSTTGNQVFQIGGTATATVTPEPSSLILLGTGLLGAAGMLVRKRRIV